MSPKKLKIFVHALSASGHLNSAIGIAQALQKRGHEIVFIINAELVEKLETYGFRTLPLTIKSGKKLSANPAKEFAEIMHEYGFLSNKTSYEKTLMLADRSDNGPMKVPMLHMIEFDPQIDRYLVQESPDLFIFDQVLYFPCLAKHSIPWMKIMSAQPACIIPPNNGIAPPLSGYSLEESDKFAAFNEMLVKTFVPFNKECQGSLNAACGFVPTGSEYIAGLFYVLSPFLNIYQYPEELIYPELLQSNLKLFAVDAFIREETGDEFMLDSSILPFSPEEKLIFLTMGSMGGVDLELMRRLVRVLSKSPHKFIVSKGPLGDELELPANMWGENSLPQTKVLPLVDMVITHGGNNTVCEAFSFGKPMLVMGLFGDQFDNAQRLTETGYGLRIEPYDFEDNQLLEAVEKLVNDSELKDKLQKAKTRIEKDDKKVKLCEEIEKIVRDYQNIGK